MAAFSVRGALPERRVSRVDLCRISPSPSQPRSEFSEDSVASLAESIRKFGLLSPLLVRRRSAGEYELIAGERRLRALKLLGHAQADVIVLGAYDRDCALIGLIENLQREQLHFLDEAEACRRILDEHNLSQEALARTLAKSASALANLLRLLKLDKRTRGFIRGAKLSERHARALLGLDSAAEQFAFAQRAARENWSVRRLEAQIAQRRAARPAAPATPAAQLVCDHRLVINALNETVRKLKHIGVRASSRVEAHEDYYDIVVTVRRNASES